MPAGSHQGGDLWGRAAADWVGRDFGGHLCKAPVAQVGTSTGGVCRHGTSVSSLSGLHACGLWLLPKHLLARGTLRCYKRQVCYMPDTCQSCSILGSLRQVRLSRQVRLVRGLSPEEASCVGSKRMPSHHGPQPPVIDRMPSQLGILADGTRPSQHRRLGVQRTVYIRKTLLTEVLRQKSALARALQLTR